MKPARIKSLAREIHGNLTKHHGTRARIEVLEDGIRAALAEEASGVTAPLPESGLQSPGAPLPEGDSAA